MKNFMDNINTVSIGDRIMVTAVQNFDLGNDYEVGDTAIVKDLEIGGVIVTFEKFVSPPDTRQTFLWHTEYKVIDKPELSRLEIIAIVFLILLLVVSFIASMNGVYDK